MGNVDRRWWINGVMALVPFAPAVAMAIHDATGVWLSQQPMTPERVLAALNAESIEGERPA